MIYNIVEPLHTKIEITKGRTYLNISFGDIFSHYDKSHIAISVNEFFDTQIGGRQGQVGDIVAENSLHGLFIKKIYHSNAQILDNNVDVALQGVASTPVNRPIGKNKKYPIGTTAVINGGNHKQFLFAFAKTDITTNKASADVPTMWYALEGLWDAVRTHSNGLPITIPLVGGGLSNVGLDSESLLKIIILSIIKASETAKITNQINIVLHDSVMKHIELKKIEKEFI